MEGIKIIQLLTLIDSVFIMFQLLVYGIVQFIELCKEEDK